MSDDELGRVAYHAYCDSVGWKSVRGENLPGWSVQAEAIKAAWIASALAVKKAAIDDHLQRLNIAPCFL